MAEKAHVVGSAFLGVEMECARCHDSPLQDVMQKDLFGIAAMLDRKAQKVPESSSVPGSPEELAEMAITVSLEPRSEVAPEWPFDDMISVDLESLPSEMIRDPQDPRKRLAFLTT